MAKTQKIAISKTFDSALQSKPAVNFEIDRFDGAIYKQGYNVYHHKALRCPCINHGSNSALPNCENCNGLGWFYVEKTLTKALMQNMDNKPQYDNWSEKNTGTVNITTMYSDDVTYMDKFEAIDLETSFSQTLRFYYDEATDKIFAFTIYTPIIINNIYKFNSSTTPLIPLTPYTDEETDWDYKVDGNKIVMNNDKYLEEFDNETLQVTVRYKHTPVYCVIDIQREVFKARDSKACSNTVCDPNNDLLSLRGQPQKSIGKRLHYIFDSENLSEPSVFDNTVYNS